MITQEYPATFAPETVGKQSSRIKLSADLVRRLRATSFAVGGLNVSQIIETMLKELHPAELIDCLGRAWEWTDPAEKRRLKEATSLAEQSGGDWESFCSGAAEMQPF